jgi:hypothetical protein
MGKAIEEQHVLVVHLRRSLAPRHDRAAGVLAARMAWHLNRLGRQLSTHGAEADHGTPTDRRLGQAARRVLQRLQSAWNDGDENRVRGYLDGALPDLEAATVAHARRLLQCAADLAATGVRAETLWFFAWYLESALSAELAIRPRLTRTTDAC